MNHDEATLEAQRDHLLHRRLSQLEEIAAVKREKLRELYHLLKAHKKSFSTFEFPLKHDNLSEQDIAECDAFVQLYEKGTINEIHDWPVEKEEQEHVPPASSPPPPAVIEPRQTRSRTKALVEGSHGSVEEMTAAEAEAAATIVPPPSAPEDDDDNLRDQDNNEAEAEEKAEESKREAEKNQELVPVEEDDEGHGETVEIEMSIDEKPPEQFSQKADLDNSAEEEMAEVEKAASMEVLEQVIDVKVDGRIEEEAVVADSQEGEEALLLYERDTVGMHPTENSKLAETGFGPATDEIPPCGDVEETGLETGVLVAAELVSDEVEEMGELEVPVALEQYQHVEHEVNEVEVELSDRQFEQDSDIEVAQQHVVEYQDDVEASGQEAEVIDHVKPTVEQSDLLEQDVGSLAADIAGDVEESHLLEQDIGSLAADIAGDAEELITTEHVNQVETHEEEAELVDLPVSPLPAEEDEVEATNGIQLYEDQSIAPGVDNDVSMDISSPSHVELLEDIPSKLELPAPQKESPIQMSSPAHEELNGESAHWDDMDMGDTSKDELDIISMPTTPAASPPPPVAPARRVSTRRLQKLAPSPMPRAEVSPPSRSPSPPVRRPRTRSLSAALAAMARPSLRRVPSLPPRSPSPVGGEVSPSPDRSPSPAVSLPLAATASHPPSPPPVLSPTLAPAASPVLSPTSRAPSPSHAPALDTAASPPPAPSPSASFIPPSPSLAPAQSPVPSSRPVATLSTAIPAYLAPSPPSPPVIEEVPTDNAVSRPESLEPEIAQNLTAVPSPQIAPSVSGSVHDDEIEQVDIEMEVTRTSPAAEETTDAEIGEERREVTEPMPIQEVENLTEPAVPEADAVLEEFSEKVEEVDSRVDEEYVVVEKEQLSPGMEIRASLDEAEDEDEAQVVTGHALPEDEDEDNDNDNDNDDGASTTHINTSLDADDLDVEAVLAERPEEAIVEHTVEHTVEHPVPEIENLSLVDDDSFQPEVEIAADRIEPVAENAEPEAELSESSEEKPTGALAEPEEAPIEPDVEFTVDDVGDVDDDVSQVDIVHHEPKLDLIESSEVEHNADEAARSIHEMEVDLQPEITGHQQEPETQLSKPEVERNELDSELIARSPAPEVEHTESEVEKGSLEHNLGDDTDRSAIEPSGLEDVPPEHSPEDAARELLEEEPVEGEHDSTGVVEVDFAEEHIDADSDGVHVVVQAPQLEINVEQLGSSKAGSVSEMPGVGSTEARSQHASSLHVNATGASSPAQSVSMELESDPILEEELILDVEPVEKQELELTIPAAPAPAEEPLLLPDTEAEFPLSVPSYQPPASEPDAVAAEVPDMTAEEPEMAVALSRSVSANEPSLSSHQDQGPPPATETSLPPVAEVISSQLAETKTGGGNGGGIGSGGGGSGGDGDGGGGEGGDGLLLLLGTTNEATPGDLNTPTHISESPTRSRSGSVSTSCGLSLTVPGWDDVAPATQSEHGDHLTAAHHEAAESDMSFQAEQSEEIPRRVTRSQSRARERSMSQLPVDMDEDEDEEMDDKNEEEAEQNEEEEEEKYQDEDDEAEAEKYQEEDEEAEAEAYQDEDAEAEKYQDEDEEAEAEKYQDEDADAEAEQHHHGDDDEEVEVENIEDDNEEMENNEDEEAEKYQEEDEEAEKYQDEGEEVEHNEDEEAEAEKNEDGDEEADKNEDDSDDADGDEDEDDNMDLEVPSDREPSQEDHGMSEGGSEMAELTVKVEEEDEEVSGVSTRRVAPSPLSRMQSDSPCTSLSPAPSLPDREESPTRSPSSSGDAPPVPVPQANDNEGNPTGTQTASPRDDGSRQVLLPHDRSPRMSLLQSLSNRPATSIQQYRLMSPLELHQYKQHSIVLDTVPTPISKQLFASVFDSTQPSEQNDEIIIKNEDQDDAMSPHTRGGSLFSSASPSPQKASIPLPDTFVAPYPTSPILNAYSTSLKLPPLEDLPSTFTRKVHPAKLARKREREREREEREKRGRTRDREPKEEGREKEREKRDGKESAKSGWVPWEISRWGAQFRANPAHKVTKRSGKALTTKMWNVALHELRLMRALERIEKLKQEGRWSFRQPKKQKGPAIAKSHWDWLLEEARWLRTDFREERKWKIAVAFTMVHAVREWHLAGPDDRRRLCVRCSPSLRALPEGNTSRSNTLQQQKVPSRSTIDLPGLDAVDPSSAISARPLEDTQEIDPEQEAEIIRVRQREQRKLAPDVVVEESVEVGVQGDGEDDADGEMDIDDTETGVEQILNEGLMEVDEAETSQRPVPSTAVKAKAPVETVIKVKEEAMHTTLTSAPAPLPGTSAPAPPSSIDKVKAKIRASFAFAADDAVYVDMGISAVEPFVPLQLPELFPEFSIFQPLHANPELAESIVIPRGDRRSEKRDKKVIEELTRQDDIADMKVVNVSTFMHYKPTLVSALQPAKHWRRERWVELDDTAVTGDDTTPAFELPPNGLFGHQRPRAGGLSPFHATTRMPRDPQRRFSDTPWSDSEDQALKQIAERYPNNWPLVADVFNSSRVTISTDKRTSWDCLARWDAKWNDGKAFAPMAGPGTPGTSELDMTAGTVSLTQLGGGPSMANAIMTRKRTANQLGLSIHGQEAESRKRRRHNHMHEAMRKSAKKREINQKAIANQQTRRMSNSINDTHNNMFGRPPNRTPAELSRLKAEKDRRDYEDFQLRKKQEDDILRKRGSQMDPVRQPTGAVRHGQLPTGQQAAPVPTVRGPTHAQVNISQQAVRLPTMNAGNLTVPNINQSVPLSTGLNINMQSFSRLTPEQQQALFAQMQARQQQQQQQQQQSSVPNIAANAAMRQRMATLSHPQMLSHLSSAQAQAAVAAHLSAQQAQSSSAPHGTPVNGMSTSNLVRAAVSQQQARPQQQQQQQARPGSSSQQAQAAAQMTRQAATPQQQAAMHHAYLQSVHAAGMTEQMKRMYQTQLSWQQQQANVSHPSATQLAFPGVVQQPQQPQQPRQSSQQPQQPQQPRQPSQQPQQPQQSSQQQNSSPSRPVSAQPNPNLAP